MSTHIDVNCYSDAACGTSKSAVELPGRRAGKVVRTYGGRRQINVGEPLIVFKAPDITADYGHGPEG
jgi:hypothetical protein